MPPLTDSRCLDRTHSLTHLSNPSQPAPPPGQVRVRAGPPGVCEGVVPLAGPGPDWAGRASCWTGPGEEAVVDPPGRGRGGSGLEWPRSEGGPGPPGAARSHHPVRGLLRPHDPAQSVFFSVQFFTCRPTRSEVLRLVPGSGSRPDQAVLVRDDPRARARPRWPCASASTALPLPARARIGRCRPPRPWSSRTTWPGPG